MIAVASIRVLIADPNEVLRAVYREFLSRDGFRVETASTALECVVQLRHFRPQILVLEPELPMGGGDGVLALMHEDPAILRVPVLLVTTGNDEDTLERVLYFPIDAIQRKPLAPSQLAGEIRSVLDSRTLARMHAGEGLGGGSYQI